jgi:outer membrane protein OmpA-like peptidoglycan-associated protein
MMAAVGIVGANSLEAPLTAAAQDALRDAGITGVDVRFDGREAYLTPSGATAAQLADAERVVGSVDGVRWVTVGRADPSAPQANLNVMLGTDGEVVVNGLAGTASEASAIQDAAQAAFGPGTVAEITVRDGVAIPAWTGTEPDLFAALAQVAEVQFLLTAEGASIAGEAADPVGVAQQLQTLLGPIPLTSTVTQAGPTDDERAAIDGTVIRFTADSVTLDKAARTKVAELADALRRFPTIGVTLTGHIAIPVGTEAAAIAFSTQRAQAVAEALIADGIDADRIEVVGAGSSQPVGDNSTPAGAAANRRVTVLIEGSD